MTTPHRSPEILRYTAFSANPAGGNPAGVVLDAAGLSDEDQLAIAADLGYSETAFLTPPPAELTGQERAYTVRYFSPKAEVSHAASAEPLIQLVPVRHQHARTPPRFQRLAGRTVP